MMIRVFYTGRDWFNQPVFGQEAAREFSTVAEGVKLVARCIGSLGLGAGCIDCFRLELSSGDLLVVHSEGLGVYDLQHVSGFSAGKVTRYGARELKKVLTGYIKNELQEVC